MAPVSGGPPRHAPPSPPPPGLTADLDGLAGHLDRVVPTKTGDNLLIGTWNIRALSGYTHRWTARSEDSPKRDWHAMACIAQVLSRFDVTAIQETRRDTSALFAILSLLGPHYRVIASDVTEGGSGNGERLAYVYDTTRVQQAWSGRSSCHRAPRARCASSRAPPTPPGWCATADRLPEITAFAQWMRSWADRPKDWNHNLLVLGDFNIDRYQNPLWQEFFATGL
ncbi:endonuclease/exonuclease/phosphatase family protein [Ornithinimicrobium sp. W1679]|uniref:endonuclease/exonuclease/phosphatase family protein n=1 Tax=Ornithinimicrobium sp. W1679 TaxID=3418770 RepID=UPI003CEDBED0